ncbi:MAG: DNA topoisomerase IB [Candidatus Dormibacteraeota bacterium]|nr:DNA topoisomerase IB [Candidatus Dormibacteraeota bacterium]MBV9524208.1 DNA topoisomerase IB [Candidatus Dormibacteraeota bacterium]
MATSAAVEADGHRTAREAGLRWVDDSAPGLRRLGAAPRFHYADAAGRRISDPKTLQRIRDIAIPPAWTDVWICPSPNGHIQATGRDARRRKQYRYHARWREVRDERKYDRMIAFGRALPGIRGRVAADLARPGLPRERVLAAVVRLLDVTLIRVGNEEYAAENRSFGLTTLRARHVEVEGSRLRFRFRGKSGVRHVVAVQDRHLAQILARCQDLPGEELFEWLDEDGQAHGIDSDAVNGYIREAGGDGFTSKDFRTWAGTVLALTALRDLGASGSRTEAKRQVVRAVAEVSRRLGNTPAVCRRCYVHPEVIEAHTDGRLLKLRLSGRAPSDAAGLRSEERAVLRLLERAGRATPRAASRAA